jgi:hypothetical protein
MEVTIHVDFDLCTEGVKSDVYIVVTWGEGHSNK